MLENANFREYSELLMKEEYDNFLSLAERQYPIKTDVTITICSSAIEFKLGSEGAIELEKLINGFWKRNIKKVSLRNPHTYQKYSHQMRVLYFVNKIDRDNTNK